MARKWVKSEEKSDFSRILIVLFSLSGLPPPHPSNRFGKVTPMRFVLCSVLDIVDYAHFLSSEAAWFTLEPGGT